MLSMVHGPHHELDGLESGSLIAILVFGFPRKSDKSASQSEAEDEQWFTYVTALAVNEQQRRSYRA